jgi:2-polyprenyl-3-methyl-5-hydroxy-6-metoxy-1,4-benzoquinol methylase
MKFFRRMAGALKREEPPYKVPPSAPHKTEEWLETISAVQSMQFMIDCLPVIRDVVGRMNWPRETPMRVLDAGTGTAGGAHILATLYSSVMLGPPMQVDAIEISSDLQRWARARFPRVNYIVGDILHYRPRAPYELTICSHTLEHIEDTHSFVRHLCSMTRQWVIFYTPWKEQNLIAGHEHSIDEAFVRAHGGTVETILTSPAWYHPVDARAECVIFAVPGRASI